MHQDTAEGALFISSIPVAAVYAEEVTLPTLCQDPSLPAAGRAAYMRTN